LKNLEELIGVVAIVMMKIPKSTRAEPKAQNLSQMSITTVTVNYFALPKINFSEVFLV
jgi:hypothetical protein